MSPAIDAVRETAEIAAIAASEVFDASWYLARYRDVAVAGLDPLLHYVRYGGSEDRWPNGYFDPAWYRQNHADLSFAGLNPVLHYLRHGDRQGQRPMPHFDTAWYRAAYALPPDALALGHFLRHRATGRFAPCAELYAVPLLARYRAAGATDGDPYRQYLDDPERDPCPELTVVAGSGLLDADYHQLNGTVGDAALLDPAVHFCRHGWRDGCKPNRYFDSEWYLDANPDARRAQVNPLLHYLREGEPAGRQPSRRFDPEWYRATYAVPAGESALAHYLARRHRQAYSPSPSFDVIWYMTRHSNDVGPGRDAFMHFLQAASARDVADASPSP